MIEDTHSILGFSDLQTALRYPAPNDLTKEEQVHLQGCLGEFSNHFDRANFTEKARSMRKLGVLNRAIKKKERKYRTRQRALANKVASFVKEKTCAFVFPSPLNLPKDILHLLIDFIVVEEEENGRRKYDLAELLTLKQVSKGFHQVVEEWEDQLIRSIEAHKYSIRKADCLLPWNSYPYWREEVGGLDGSGAMKLAVRHHIEVLQMAGAIWFRLDDLLALSKKEQYTPRIVEDQWGDPDHVQRMTHFMELRGFRLLDCGHHCISEKSVENFNQFPHMKYLSLEVNPLGDWQDRHLTRLFQLRELTHLKVVGRNQFSHHCLVGIGKLRALRSLVLGPCTVTDRSMEDLLQLPLLEYLSFELPCLNHPLTSFGISRLQNLKTLKQLKINDSQSRIEDPFLQAMTAIDSLKELIILGGAHFTSEGILGLERCKNLTHFYWHEIKRKLCNHFEEVFDSLKKNCGIQVDTQF